MDDLISKKAAIDAVNSLTYPSSLMDVKRQLIGLQPAEPKRGKWNKLDRDVFNCNKCGATFDINQGGEKMYFCPNCGADMREVTT